MPRHARIAAREDVLSLSLTLTESAPATGEQIAAAALVSPMVQLRNTVDATG